jgi:calcineurin-like phosphoesterase
MNLLIIGDISGEDGKRAIKSLLPEIKKKYTIDLVIANIENVTNGRGCSISDYMYLITNGVDYCTLGNHA